VPLPLSAHKFFLRVFDNARQSPDACTLKPVYLVLNGACRNLLSLLSEKSREQFDQTLCHILTSKEATQNCMLMLWCFGIVLLVEHTYETVEQQELQSSMDTTPITSKTQWRTVSGRKMFRDDSKISKTINLSYVNVIFATKGDVGVLDEDAVEGIRIAVRTLQCVDQAMLREWPRSSIRAKSTFEKLPDKILRPNVNPAVQLEALCFYSMVAGECNIPSDIVAQYERCVADVAGLEHSDHLGETLLISLPIYTVSMLTYTLSTYLTLSATNFTKLCSNNARQGSGFVCSARRLSLSSKLHKSSRTDHDYITQMRLFSERNFIRRVFW
jgi:hypothetical protein